MSTPADSGLAASTLFNALLALALVGSLALRLWLSSRQMAHVARHSHEVPRAFASTVSLEAHRHAARYTLSKGRFALWSTAADTLVFVGWTWLGGLALLDGFLRESVGAAFGGMPYQLALLACVVIVNALLQIPLDAWSTFRIEQAFGFNRTSRQLFVSDLLKSALITALIGLPLAAAFLWVMGHSGGLWWLWCWIGWVAFNLLAMVLYPTFIAPIFNSFRPLNDSTLQAQVESLMTRCGFTAKGFYVMDGSRRSAHANAYFTGFGKSKRVVFFDTLLAKLSAAEVRAVLAHELGHFARRHVPKRLIWMFGLSLCTFALLGWMSHQIWFFEAFGIRPSMTLPNDAVALLLMIMVVPVFGFFAAPVWSWLSRQHEFEADAYAVTHASADDLAAALLKLYKDNASTLTPDPLFASFYYSHPPAVTRLAALHAASTA